MVKVFTTNRKSILIVCGLVFLFSAVALALNISPNNQPQQDSSRKQKSEVVKQVEASPEQLLKVVGNNDCPLRLAEARVKEIPGDLFTKLTGKTTDLATVSSVPEAKLVNTSGKTITGFVLVVRDPQSQTNRGIVQNSVAIKPGETYTVRREHFGTSEKLTMAGKDGQIQQTSVEQGVNSEKHWLDFAPPSNIFVTIGMVNFEDGSRWMIKEGGEVR